VKLVGRIPGRFYRLAVDVSFLLCAAQRVQPGPRPNRSTVFPSLCPISQPCTRWRGG